MSTLYTISVHEVEDDTTAVLDVQVVHPDSMYISATPGFALMVLWESTDGDEPLAAEVDLDTALDAGWMRKYAKGFVTAVELVELENEPSPAARDDYEHAYWKEPDGWLRGAIRVEVSDPAWIAHLSAGQAWDSAAFESNSTFDPCDPIRFEQAKAPAASDDPRAGLLPVPRIFFLDYLDSVDDEFIWFPKYSDKAYVTEELYEGDALTDEVLDSLVGEVVWYSNYSDTVGVLLPNRTVAHISATGSRGATGVRAGDGKIGAARFNTNKKRLAEPVTISGLVRAAYPAVISAEVDGATATLTVYSFDANRQLDLNHEAEALALIASPECESFDRFANATSALGRLLHAKSQEHGISFENELYTKFGTGIIVGSTVQKTASAEPIDYDALPDDELMAKLSEDPWDTWTIEITVTDPAFVEHLPSITPYGHTFGWVGDPEPWDGEPLTTGA